MNDNMIDVFKALSNETRLNILKWLKNPDEHFPVQGCHLPPGTDLRGGVCVGSIQEKAGISQSVTSQYLDMMLRTGLLEMERIGKWTYYRRNEDRIKEVAKYIETDL